VPHEAVAKLVTKLSNQRDIKIDYKIIKAPTHFLQRSPGSVEDVVDEYLTRVLPASAAPAKGKTKAAAR